MNTPTRILVVDDDPAIIKLLSKMLSLQHYEVWEASTGQRGLAMTRERHPDLVLLDVRLPDLNGIEVCRQIKTDPALTDTFVVLISGEATDSAHKVDGLETGADEYIAKPFDMEEFLARMRTLVRLRHTTAALRSSEHHYRRLVEILPDAVGLIDQNQRVQAVNRQAAAIMGFASAEELVGRSVFELMPPECHDRFSAEMKAALKTGGIRDAEFQALKKSGESFPVEMSAAVSDDLNGRPAGFVIVARDITARKAAETKIRELLHILDQSHDAILICDVAGRIQYFNKGSERLLGWSADEVRGRLSTDVFSSNECQFKAAREKLLQTGEWNGELHVFTKARQSLIVHSRWTLVHSRANQPPRVVCINTDVTDRKWTERLLQSQRDFGTFLSTTNNLELAARRLLEIALKNEGADCGGVYLVDGKTGALSLAAHQGLSEKLVKRVSHFGADSLQVRLANTGQAVYWQHGEPMADIARRLKHEGLLTVEAVPIKHDGQIVAVLNVGSHQHAQIPSEVRLAIEAVAAQAGGAIARIRAQQLLRTHQQLLEKTLQSLRAAVLITDAETAVIQECNPAATSMFGYARQELIGRTSAKLHLDETACARFAEHLHSEMKRKGFLSDFEFRMKRKDGCVFPSDHSMMPIRDEVGRILSWVSVVRDISKQKKTEQELRNHASRIIEAQEDERLRLARDLHDGVNQLMASAKMRLRKVEASIAGLSPASREMLARCHDLLVQALEENRRIAQNLRPSDLDEFGLAAACRNLCKRIQSRTGFSIKCDISNSRHRLAPAVEMNLYRVIQEALANIEKHANARRVRLKIASKRDSVLLRIEDDGIGFRVKPSGTKRKRGGMGLMNMRERAASLGGHCKVESVPKRGTVITIQLPSGRATE